MSCDGFNNCNTWDAVFTPVQNIVDKSAESPLAGPYLTSWELFKAQRACLLLSVRHLKKKNQERN